MAELFSPLFDGFEGVEPERLEAPDNILCTLRCKPDAQQVVLHVLSRNYDKDKKRMAPLAEVKISFEEPSIRGTAEWARVLSYDAPEQRIPVRRKDGLTQITLPELRLWTLVVFD